MAASNLKPIPARHRPFFNQLTTSVLSDYKVTMRFLLFFANTENPTRTEINSM